MSAYSPPTHTVGEVITDVTRKFGDEAGIELENNDIVRWINDAMDVIVSRNTVLKARVKIPTVAGKNDYPLLQYSIQEIDAVHYNGLRLPVMPFAEAEERLFSSDDYADESGDPVLWYAWDAVMYLWPVPQADGELEIYYSAKAQHVTLNANAILPFPDKYYQAIVLYVLQQAREMGEDWQAAQATQAQFDTTLSSFGDDDRTEQNLTYPVVQTVDDF